MALNYNMLAEIFSPVFIKISHILYTHIPYTHRLPIYKYIYIHIRYCTLYTRITKVNRSLPFTVPNYSISKIIRSHSFICLIYWPIFFLYKASYMFGNSHIRLTPIVQILSRFTCKSTSFAQLQVPRNTCTKFYQDFNFDCA